MGYKTHSLSMTAPFSSALSSTRSPLCQQQSFPEESTEFAVGSLENTTNAENGAVSLYPVVTRHPFKQLHNPKQTCLMEAGPKHPFKQLHNPKQTCLMEACLRHPFKQLHNPKQTCLMEACPEAPLFTPAQEHLTNNLVTADLCFLRARGAGLRWVLGGRWMSCRGWGAACPGGQEGCSCGGGCRLGWKGSLRQTDG